MCRENKLGTFIKNGGSDPGEILLLERNSHLVAGEADKLFTAVSPSARSDSTWDK